MSGFFGNFFGGFAGAENGQNEEEQRDAVDVSSDNDSEWSYGNYSDPEDEVTGTDFNQIEKPAPGATVAIALKTDKESVAHETSGDFDYGTCDSDTNLETIERDTENSDSDSDYEEVINKTMDSTGSSDSDSEFEKIGESSDEDDCSASENEYIDTGSTESEEEVENDDLELDTSKSDTEKANSDSGYDEVSDKTTDSDSSDSEPDTENSEDKTADSPVEVVKAEEAVATTDIIYSNSMLMSYMMKKFEMITEEEMDSFSKFQIIGSKSVHSSYGSDSEYDKLNDYTDEISDSDCEEVVTNVMELVEQDSGEWTSDRVLEYLAAKGCVVEGLKKRPVVVLDEAVFNSLVKVRENLATVISNMFNYLKKNQSFRDFLTNIKDQYDHPKNVFIRHCEDRYKIAVF